MREDVLGLTIDVAVFDGEECFECAKLLRRGDTIFGRQVSSGSPCYFSLCGDCIAKEIRKLKERVLAGEFDVILCEKDGM